MARVTVIIGVYNVKSKKDVEVTVDSLINQTYKDWELIICDDGSTNNTYELLQEFEKKDSRIKVIGYKENKGLSTALNACIDIADSEYIARQDIEDISHPERLEKQIKFLDENLQYDIVGCNANVFDENGVWTQYLVKEAPAKEDFLWTSQFLHPTVVFRKESLVKAGCYRVSPETRRNQDYDLFMQMYSLGMKGYNMQEILFDYYQVDGHQTELSWKRRYYEMIIRLKGFKKMGLLPKGLPYAVKPLIVKLIPHKIYRMLKKGEGGATF